VAFANEEAPFFYGDEMGSNRYATRAKAQGERIEAMLSLETIGYFTDQPGSQGYPFPFSYFYPDTGNFIGFVGNLSSRRRLSGCLLRSDSVGLRCANPIIAKNLTVGAASSPRFAPGTTLLQD
jgi:hypothetical protein